MLNGIGGSTILILLVSCAKSLNTWLRGSTRLGQMKNGCTNGLSSFLNGQMGLVVQVLILPLIIRGGKQKI